MLIGILGCGHMGQAMAKALSPSGHHLILTVKGSPAKKALQKIFKHATVTQNNKSAVKQANVIFLSVRPNIAEEVLTEIKDLVRDKIIISVVSGLAATRISELTGTTQIITAMPNLPTALKQGVVIWYSHPKISGSKKNTARKLLQKFGLALEVKDPRLVKKSSLGHGCGPGYLAYLMHLLITEVRKLGFNEKQSREIILQTFTGTVQLIKKNHLAPKELLDKVATPGGITEQMVLGLKTAKLENAIHQGFIYGKKKLGIK